MGGVDFQEVETGLIGTDRGSDELRLNGIHAGPIQLHGGLVLRAVWKGRRADGGPVA